MEEHYWLAGKVNIPENKKKEFNACVMEVLNLCGIRKQKTIMLAGKAATVLDKPQPYRDGIVLFDYSIFERKCRTVSMYNTQTCELRTIDRGVGEFGLAMNLILLLSECYSEGSCYFMLDRKLVYIPAYMDMLCTLLNRKFMINSRAKVWDILMFMKDNPECDMPEQKELLDGLPWGYYDWDDLQMDGLFASEGNQINEPKKEPITERKQIPNATYRVKTYYLYQTMTAEYQCDKVGLIDFLRRLLDLPLADRAEWAKSSNGQGIIAEVSLYVHPAEVVSIVLTDWPSTVDMASFVTPIVACTCDMDDSKFAAVATAAVPRPVTAAVTGSIFCPAEEILSLIVIGLLLNLLSLYILFYCSGHCIYIEWL